jgi:hypothetical protein
MKLNSCSFVAVLMNSYLFEPTLCSRGSIPAIALEMYHRDEFQKEMKKLLMQGPTGTLTIPTLQEALKKLFDLKKRVVSIEKKLENQSHSIST